MRAFLSVFQQLRDARRVRPTLFGLCLLIFVLGVPGGARPLAAQDTSIALAVQAAFGGVYRPGAWLPLTVDLSNDGADRQVAVHARAGNGAQYVVNVDLPGGARKQVTLYVFLPTSLDTLAIAVRSDGAELALAEVPLTPLRSREQLIGVLSESGAMPLVAARLPDATPLTTIPLRLNDLPDHAQGLSSFAALLLDDLPTADLRPSQVSALADWVLRGGNLLISGGSGAERTLAGLPLALQPATLGPTRTLPAATIFAATDAGAPDLPFVSLLPPADPAQAVALPAPLRGAASFDQPILLIRSYGAGHVLQSAVPLGHPALRSVADPALFWADLLRIEPALPSGFGPDGMMAGDMVDANLASALTNVPALEFPSLLLLGTLLLVYVLLVGPGMYLLLRRFDRQIFGWIAVPLLTLLFAGLAYGIGYRQRGGDVLLNQITLIEGLSGSNGQARIRTFAGLFSPARAAYALESSSIALRPISLQGPWDFPATTSNGIFVQDGAAGSRADNLMVEQWSMSAVAAETIAADAGLTAQVQISGKDLQAQVENRSTTTMNDVVVVQGDLVLRLGDLAPGAQAGGVLQRPGHVAGQFGATFPLSYLIYGEQMDELSRRGLPHTPDIQMRVRLLDALFSYGPMPPNEQPMVIGWNTTAPLDIRPVQVKAAIQQHTLIIGAAQIRASDTELSLDGDWFVPRFSGRQISPCYGNSGVGVSLTADPILAELSLPPDLATIRPSGLTFFISSDGAIMAGTTIEVYDWHEQTWQPQPVDQNAIAIAEPAKLISSDGRVLLRLSGDPALAGFGNCVYIDVELKGTL